MIRGKLPIAFLCKFSLTPAKITAELESHQFRIYRQNITYKTCWILQIIHIQYLHLFFCLRILPKNVISH